MTDEPEAANTIAARVHPDIAARLITWRDTELGAYEEEDVKALGHQVI